MNYSVSDAYVHDMSDDALKSRKTQVHRMLVQFDETFKSADAECHLVDYMKLTDNFRSESKSEAVCAMLRDIAENGVKREFYSNISKS